MKVAVGLVLTLALHVLLGWQASLLGGLIAGFWARSTVAGTVALGGSWLVLILYNYVADAATFSEMTRVVGALLGGLPALALPLLSVSLALLLGTLAGFLGKGLRNQLT